MPWDSITLNSGMPISPRYDEFCILKVRYRPHDAEHRIRDVDARKRAERHRPGCPGPRDRVCPYRCVVILSCLPHAFILDADYATPTSTRGTDTAQSYRNEVEAGQALKDSGLARSDVFVTTKFSGSDGLDVPTSIRNSVKNVSISLPGFRLKKGCKRNLIVKMDCE